MVTLSNLHREVRLRLKKAGVEDAPLEARILIEGLTGASRTEAIAAPDRAVEAQTVAAVLAAVERRAAGEPVHRILGWREFYGLRLELSPDTLEPRPDTETLVDLVLPFASGRTAATGACRILDLGTGTGAIALALLAEVPLATALAVDISAQALATAVRNADINRVASRFAALRSDWFERVEGEFDLIVSNPPYIPTGIWQTLEREVRDFDPRLALDAGQDGLDAYRAIAARAGRHVAPDGIAAVEVGHDQREAVTEIFAESGWRLTDVRRDLGAHDRALVFAMRDGPRRSVESL